MKMPPLKNMNLNNGSRLERNTTTKIRDVKIISIFVKTILR